MRLYSVDTPEIEGRCRRERHLAQQATALHLKLISSGITAIERFGQDRYGRSLVNIQTRSGNVRTVLLQQGLADVFGDGVRARWCG